MSLTLDERLANSTTPWMKALKLLQSELHVAMPAMVQSFDPETQTVVVQPAIREQLLNSQRVPIPTPLPVVSYVPIVMMRAGEFVLTMPVQAGDECLLIIADSCFDAWWQSGGIQNQIDLRRHDISDAFAVLGPWSQPNKVENYSTSAAQLRSLDGQTVIEVGSGEVKITASNVTIQAAQEVTINGTSGVKINGTDWQTHTHNGVQSGGSVTGPVAS
jgi:hypothetical protein